MRVKRDPCFGYLLDIELAEKQQPRPKFDPDARFEYLCDKDKGLEFIAHVDRAGNWISLSPMNKQIRLRVGPRPTAEHAIHRYPYNWTHRH